MLRELEVKKLSRTTEISAPADAVVVRWLGQAGFLLRYGDLVIAVDVYLSDFLAKKYKNSEFAHVRMMPPPVSPNDVRNLSWVLCTHRHSDHMDPETLPLLLQRNAQCRLIAPRAEKEYVLSLGLEEHRIHFVDAGERIDLGNEVKLEVIASAHEQFKTNERGEHHFLGYVLRLGVITLYHSGDCVPYEGLAQILSDMQVDVAMLPINGRDQYRRSRGVPGNFTLDEAMQLCRSAGIDCMIGHHFGMFDFNTIDASEAGRLISDVPGDLDVILPEVDKVYLLFAEDKRRKVWES